MSKIVNIHGTLSSDQIPIKHLFCFNIDNIEYIQCIDSFDILIATHSTLFRIRLSPLEMDMQFDYKELINNLYNDLINAMLDEKQQSINIVPPDNFIIIIEFKKRIK